METRSRKAQSDWFQHLSGASRFKLFAAIFCIFAPLSLIIAAGLADDWPWWVVAGWMLGSGLIAVGWAATFMWNMKVMFILIPFQALVGIASTRLNRTAELGEPNITQAAIVTVAMIVVGYVFFVVFLNKEGAKTLRLQTEIGLAKQIHSHLVPTISLRTRKLDIYGRSISSMEVGGDLVDVVQDERSLGLYVADVSGHGVKAGVFMSMVKSAIRMKLLHSSALDQLCADLNRVVFQVKEPEMFVTFAAMRFDDRGEAEYILAGHPSILHYRKASATVEELPSGAPPLGVVEDLSFEAGRVAIEPGDLLVLLTDGLIEIVDEWDPDVGMARISALVAAAADRPVDELYAHIMTDIRRRADVDDDQTLLVARVV
jgi:hypothetical protein